MGQTFLRVNIWCGRSILVKLLRATVRERLWVSAPAPSIRLAGLAFLLVVVGCGPANQSPNGLGTPTAGSVATPSMSALLVADCRWEREAHAYVDENANKLLDTGEGPLQGVIFYVDDTLNSYNKVGSPATSDAEGNAALVVDLAGCPQAEFEVYVEPPEGYTLTTDERVQASGELSGDQIAFGFQQTQP